MGEPRSVRKWVSDHAVPLLIVLVALIGVVASVTGYLMASDTKGLSRAFWLEVAKAGVQILAVAVVGGLAAAAWKTREQRREKDADDKLREEEGRSERRAKIRAELAELVDLYNDVKTVRRTLRNLGLDAKLHVPHLNTKREGGMDLSVMSKGIELKGQKREKRRLAYEGKPPEAGATQAKGADPSKDELELVGRNVRLTVEQARGFHEQMRFLNTLQLGYEAKRRQFEQAEFLGKDTDAVVKELEFIQSNVNDLVNLWEEYGWMIREGSPLGPVSEWLQDLFRQGKFRPSISEPMAVITAIMNGHLFATPRQTDEPQARRTWTEPR